MPLIITLFIIGAAGAALLLTGVVDAKDLPFADKIGDPVEPTAVPNASLPTEITVPPPTEPYSLEKDPNAIDEDDLIPGVNYGTIDNPYPAGYTLHMIGGRTLTIGSSDPDTWASKVGEYDWMADDPERLADVMPDPGMVYISVPAVWTKIQEPRADLSAAEERDPDAGIHWSIPAFSYLTSPGEHLYANSSGDCENVVWPYLHVVEEPEVVDGGLCVPTTPELAKGGRWHVTIMWEEADWSQSHVEEHYWVGG